MTLPKYQTLLRAILVREFPRVLSTISKRGGYNYEDTFV